MSDVDHGEHFLGWHRHKNGWLPPARSTYIDGPRRGGGSPCTRSPARTGCPWSSSPATTSGVRARFSSSSPRSRSRTSPKHRVCSSTRSTPGSTAATPRSPSTPGGRRAGRRPAPRRERRRHRGREGRPPPRDGARPDRSGVGRRDQLHARAAELAAQPAQLPRPVRLRLDVPGQRRRHADLPPGTRLGPGGRVHPAHHHGRTALGDRRRAGGPVRRPSRRGRQVLPELERWL